MTWKRSGLDLRAAPPLWIRNIGGCTPAWGPSQESDGDPDADWSVALYLSLIDRDRDRGHGRRPRRTYPNKELEDYELIRKTFHPAHPRESVSRGRGCKGGLSFIQGDGQRPVANSRRWLSAPRLAGFRGPDGEAARCDRRSCARSPPWACRTRYRWPRPERG